MKTRSLIMLFLIFINFFNAYSQERFEKIYKIKGRVLNFKEINNQKDLQTIIDKLQYDYSIGQKTTVRILRYSQDKYLPEAINTPEKRNDPEKQKIIFKYTAFCIYQFQLSCFNGAYCYLLYIPKDKNLKMPDGYRAETDFFILTIDGEFSKKGESIDWKREDNLITENFNFLKLNDIIHYLPYLNDMSISNYNNRVDKNGNLIYNQPIGREITGFFENIYIKTPQSKCYAVSYYDAGQDLESAKNSLKLMGDLLLNGEFNLCYFNLIKYETPDAIQSFRLQSDQCFEKPYILEFALFENNKLDSKNNQKPGYTIMLALKNPESPEDAYWTSISDEKIKNLKNSGYDILNNCMGNNELIKCDISLSTPMEVKWELYAQNSEADLYIYDYYNDKFIDIKPNWIQIENNLWYSQSTMKLEKGDYKFKQSEKQVGKGYWIVCLGEKDDKEKQKQIKEKEKQREELMEWAKTNVTNQLKDIGYQDIKEQRFYSEQDVQKVRLYYPGFQTQAFIITSHQGTKVSVVDGKGNVIVPNSKIVDKNGLYFHGVYFKMLPDNEYFILIDTPSNKYDNTLLMYGLKK